MKKKLLNYDGLDSKEKSFDIKTLKNYFNQKTLIGVTVAGFIVFLAVYIFVFLDYTQKTEELEISNVALQSELDILEEYYNNMSTYKMEIEEMKQGINSILDEYPADAREEDILMLAVQTQEKNAIIYKSINMEEKEGVYTVGQDVVTVAGMDDMVDDVVFTQKHATYVNETTYDNLKECIAQIYDSPNRIGIDSIVYSKNKEKGVLEGNINLYFYSVTGSGKEYVAPDIAEYISGTDDLFKASKVVKKNDSVNDEESVQSEQATETEETTE